MIVYWRIF